MGAVVHAYNSSYLGDRDREDHGSRPGQAKSSQYPISTNKPGMVIHVCGPTYAGSYRQGDHSLKAGLGKKSEPLYGK
jgi:hypothetical protein